ncbi:MAG TPA: citrate synthase [Bacteriovoracaceae bacterium]|nr:citrate synthase [Bacteriovoracaceae bacterium]
MSDKAKLVLGDLNYELPIFVGTEGERAIDVTKLRADTGYVTLDSGYMDTGACTSAITFLDGEKGILKYRGYSIEEIAEKSTFIESSYLVFYGKLPTEDELKRFQDRISLYDDIPEGLKAMIKVFPKDAHPMAILASNMVALSAFYHDLCVPDLNPAQKDQMIVQLMGQIKIMAAYAYRHSQGKEFVKSDKNLDYCSDFIHMMTGNKNVDKEVARALDILLILHVDHEQNCSTSSVRLVGSSKANIFATLSAGIDALWGPLHGGANQAVLEMLEEIKKSGLDYKQFLNQVKDKNSASRLMGFGHRVYKNFDPRAKIIKKACDSVLVKLGVQDPLLDIAKGLEEVALQDEYFVTRKLYPNVDFYSGIIYRALGIPTNMFTVMFAMGRLPGWMAQWKEMVEQPGFKICRPRQIYVGDTKNEYIDIKKRK